MIWVFVLYLIGLVLITVYSARKIKNENDYVIGGKKISGVGLALSERATGESAWLLLGLTGESYALGIQTFWYALGCVLGIAFIWFVMAKRLQKLTDDTGALTIPGLISKKFPGSERSIGLISSLIIIFFLLFYIEAQFYGGGKVLNDTFGIHEFWGIVIGSAVVIMYCFFGGFITVVATDIFQAVLMIITLIALPIILLYIAGINNIDIVHRIAVSSDAHYSLTGGKTGITAFLLVLSGLSWFLGYMGQPQLLTRMMAIRDQKEIKAAKWVAIIWTLIAYIGALAIGFLGYELVKDGIVTGKGAVLSEDCEKILPVVINFFVGPVIASILLSGAISAMMSTASSEIILCSSAAAEDIYPSITKRKLSSKQMLTLNKILTLAIGIIAFIMALTLSKSVFKLVSYAWSGIGSSFGPALLLLLFWKKLSRAGVIASLLSGSISTIIWSETFASITGVSERLTSFAFAFAMAVLFSYLIPEKEKITQKNTQ